MTPEEKQKKLVGLLDTLQKHAYVLDLLVSSQKEMKQKSSEESEIEKLHKLLQH